MSLHGELFNHMRAFINLIYPDQCVVCQTLLRYDEGYICNGCLKKIRLLRAPFCKKCAQELAPYAGTETRCPACRISRFHFKRCYSVVRYDETVKKILHEIKYKKRQNCLSIFKPYIYEKLRTINASAVHTMVIVPVPLEKSRKKEREFNQSAMIADYISNYYKLPYNASVLKRIKKNVPQSMLNRKMRLENLKNTFTVHHKRIIEGKEVLLVDDVLTTGSTVNECTKTLINAGAKNVTVFTLARTV